MQGGGARLKLQIVEGQMISQQVNNSVNVQSIQSAQVSRGTNVSSTQALSGLTKGLIGSEAASSVSGSSAGVEAAGSVSNLLGPSPSISQTEAILDAFSQQQQQLQERVEAAFSFEDPQNVKNHVKIKDGDYGAISDYASAWIQKAVSGFSDGTPATNGQDLATTFNLKDLAMTPEEVTQYYRDVIGIKTYGYMPSQNIQTCAPSFLQNDSILANIERLDAQIRSNLTSKGSLSANLTGSKNSTNGLTSYFQNVAPSVSSQKNASAGYDYSSMLSSLGSKDSFSVFTDKSIAYADLTSLYQNGTIASGTKLSDNSALVPEFDYSEYMQQVQDMYSQGYDSMISDYMSACGLSDSSSISSDTVAVQSLQTTAMSTSELVNKYNSEMTDGILSLSELQAMYEKALSANGVGATLLA